MFVVFALTFWLVVFSCPPFTASLELAATSPSARLLILLLPALIPAPVTLTVLVESVGLVIVSPLVSNLLFPVVTVVNVGFAITL